MHLPWEGPSVLSPTRTQAVKSSGDWLRVGKTRCHWARNWRLSFSTCQAGGEFGPYGMVS